MASRSTRTTRTSTTARARSASRRVYFVATRHEEFADPDWTFPAGSVVLDPWRFVPERPGVEVVPVGVGRGLDAHDAGDAVEALTERSRRAVAAASERT